MPEAYYDTFYREPAGLSPEYDDAPTYEVGCANKDCYEDDKFCETCAFCLKHCEC